MRILVVEDDEKIASFLERALTAKGYQVSRADRGDDGLEMAMEPEIGLVILDLSLPGLDGLDALEKLRQARREKPVLVLTARDALDQKVRALDLGADDYMTKPFALDELLARLRALTRRADQRSSDAIEIGEVRLDLLSRRAFRDDEAIDLSTREFALLEYFMRHPDQVLSRTQILASVWEYDFDPQSNIVDVYVRYLRGKVDSPGGPSVIETVRGAGYRFRASG